MGLFQFTHPGKGATGRAESSPLSTMFQFTHPGKGATALGIKFYSRSEVSIHAPWEGCDTAISFDQVARKPVSIHAPWEGCDYFDK